MTVATPSEIIHEEGSTNIAAAHPSHLSNSDQYKGINDTTKFVDDKHEKLPRIFIVAGPAATGKSTVAQVVAKTYGFPYIEGDDLHSPENIQKMASGHPLTDDDRWEWLKTVCTTSLSHASIPSNPPNKDQKSPPVVITTCSALKRIYRDYLRQQIVFGEKPLGVLYFVFLTGSEEELVHRTEKRKGHYMKSDMVKSQLKTMEVPSQGGNEEDDCKVIFTDNIGPAEVEAKAVDIVNEIMVNDIRDLLDANGSSYSSVENGYLY